MNAGREQQQRQRQHSSKSNGHTWNISYKIYRMYTKLRLCVCVFTQQPRPLTAISYDEQLKQMIICTWHVEFFDFHYMSDLCTSNVLFIVYLVHTDAKHGIRSAHMECRVAWRVDSFASIRFDSLTGKCVFTLINLTLLLLWHVNVCIRCEVACNFMKDTLLWQNFVANIIECYAMWCMAHNLSVSVWVCVCVYSAADCMLLFIGKSAWRDHSHCRCFDTLTNTPTLAHSTGWLTDWECNACIDTTSMFISIFEVFFIFATTKTASNFITLL